MKDIHRILILSHNQSQKKLDVVAFVVDYALLRAQQTVKLVVCQDVAIVVLETAV